MSNPSISRAGRRALIGALAAAALATGALAAAPAATAQPSATPPGHAHAEAAPASDFIVKFAAGASAHGQGRAHAWGAIAAQLGLKPQEVRELATGATLVSAGRELDPAESVAFVQGLLASGVVEYAEPDVVFTADLTPTDPRYAEQWDLAATSAGMSLPAAWDRTTGAGVKVAVLDTGRTAHPDLDANMLPGYDFISSTTRSRDGNGRDADPQDEGDWSAAGECSTGSAAKNSSWHGTHVAGTVGAVMSNGAGVAGVAAGAKIVPVRVLGKCGGSTSDIADAIIWASGGTVAGVPANPNPAQVINMSIGGIGACPITYQTAIDAAVARGATVVVSAGDDATDASGQRPANCDNVVVVAASDKYGSLASYSNYGSAVTVTAPGGGSGGGILSTLNAGTTVPGAATYGTKQGTSMAAPHIAGLAALLKSANPSLTPAQIEALIQQGAKPLPGGCSLGCGAGLADAAATLALVPAPQP